MSGTAYSCGAEGVFSVLAVVAAGAVMDPAEGLVDSDPVVIHVTSCAAHFREVQKWLRRCSPMPDMLATFRTSQLLDHWDELTAPLEDMPIYAMSHSA